jgi:hypothetical protein
MRLGLIVMEHFRWYIYKCKISRCIPNIYNLRKDWGYVRSKLESNRKWYSAITELGEIINWYMQQVAELN